jgi:tRNA-modifying protein YgfZ
MTEGYQALRRSAAVIDLSNRTRIRATGDDRARLLHALTTNHVQQLLPGHGCYAFFLNANGRILADANLFAFAEHLMIDAEPEVRAFLYAHIDHYIIADDVTLHDDTDTTFCLSVEGPHAAERLSALGAPTPSNDFAHEPWQDFTIARASFTGAQGFRIFGPIERKQAALDLLYLPQSTPEDADTVRLEHGHPRYGADITDKNLTAETDLTQALHFQKGCYLGQEIVERVRSRGHVNKRLTAVTIETRQAPPHGAKLTSDGKEIGELMSSAFSPHEHHVVGLAYLRVPHDAPGAAFEVEGAAGKVK